MVRGSPSICMRTQVAPASAVTGAIAGSKRKAATSLTIVAPASSARFATSALVVSIEMRTPSPASVSITGMTRATSSETLTGWAPGRVDSPPMSRIWAPSTTSSRPCTIAASASRKRPPSENESGVTLTIPITSASTGASSRFAAASGIMDRMQRPIAAITATLAALAIAGCGSDEPKPFKEVKQATATATTPSAAVGEPGPSADPRAGLSQRQRSALAPLVAAEEALVRRGDAVASAGTAADQVVQRVQGGYAAPSGSTPEVRRLAAALGSFSGALAAIAAQDDLLP